jgi:hypothetical protein
MRQNKEFGKFYHRRKYITKREHGILKGESHIPSFAC